jgi:hypothetical protein
MTLDDTASAGAPDPYQQAMTVKRAHQDELMRKANVVGVGVGLRQKSGALTDEVVLVVMVKQKVRRKRLAPADVIPAEIDGVPVDVQEVGEIEAQS